MDNWSEWFLNLQKAALKPQQRIIAVKIVIILKMIHILRLAEVGICKLRKVNIPVKKFYKQFLHLSEWTPDSWVHHPTGWVHHPTGGSLSDISELILKTRKKAAVKNG